MFGVIPIDKPTGWTSRDVVNRIHGILRAGLVNNAFASRSGQGGDNQAVSTKPTKKPALKVGHTGTLDPLASGVLLIAVGPATRLVEFSHRSRKAYVGEFRFGCTSDTLDIEGEVQQVDLARSIGQSDLESELPNWIGEIEQIPPKYSAVHINGQRAYNLARKGAEFEMPSRRVTIHRLEMGEFCFPDWSISMECSTGTYVRSLGDDIAQALGTRAIMTKLKRTQVGAVRLEDCLPFDKSVTFDDLVDAMLPPSVLLETLPSVTLPEDAAKLIRNGIPLEEEHVFASANACDKESAAAAEHLFAVDGNGYLVGVLQPSFGATASRTRRYRSVRVFQDDVAQSAPTASQPSSMNRPQSPES